MLRPGDTLHVYGVTAAPLPEGNARDLAGVLEDGGWSYFVFTREASADLRALGLEPSYEATLAYEDWLDGDLGAPVEEAGLVVVPPWLEPPTGRESSTLVIEPSLAFGTGAHPTTRRCLRLIGELIERHGAPEVVLDLGCGTGVLSLAALRLGAGRVVGCDISSLAVEVARSNAERNGLADRVELQLASAAELGRPADLVLANLPPAALGELLSHRSLGRARWVVSSGMLAGHFEQLEAELPAEVEIARGFVDGFWHTALLERRAGGSCGGHSPALRRPEQ